MSTPDQVRFGAFEFDFNAQELRRNGVPVRLQPQPVQVLALLLSKPGHLVTRNELREIWQGRFVEFDPGLNFSIGQVRKALGDSADSPSWIETVPRRGYRFIGSVATGAVLT